MSTFKDDNLQNGHWIYRAWITKNGKRIYPKYAKAFRIWVEDGEDGF